MINFTKTKQLILLLCIALPLISWGEILCKKFDGLDTLIGMDVTAWKFEQKLNVEFKTVNVRVVLRTRTTTKHFSTKLISETLSATNEDLKNSVPITIMISGNTIIVRAFNESTRKELDKSITEDFVPCDKYGTGLSLDDRQILMANYGGNPENGELSNMVSYLAVELEFE